MPPSLRRYVRHVVIWFILSGLVVICVDMFIENAILTTNIIRAIGFCGALSLIGAGYSSVMLHTPKETTNRKE